MENFKKIEHPTGNWEIDWLLENKRHAINDAGDCIRFLIDKINELQRAVEELSNDVGGLSKHDVIKSDFKRVVKQAIKDLETVDGIGLDDIVKNLKSVL